MKLIKTITFTLICCFTTFASNLSIAGEPQIKESDIITPQPTDDHLVSTKRVTSRLVQSHYRKFELDDHFSNQIFDRYIDWLDGSHKIFLQSDVDMLRAKYADQLDDELYYGKLDAAYKIYDLMAKRRYQRYRYLLKLVEKEPDLTTNDKIEKDREKAPFPKTTEDAEKLWEQRYKYDVITQYLKHKTWKETQKKLTKRYNISIRRLTQTNADDILQTYLNSFTREIDPHTTYLSPRSAQRFEESMKLSLEGIGATLYMDDDFTTIRSLVKGAPAARSKQIHIDDKIVGVGQATGEIEDVVGWRINDVVDKIKGKKGTKVRLEIEPAKGGKNHIVTLIRDTIRLEESAAKLTTNKINGKQVAVIEIPTFYMGLTKDVQKLLTEVNEKNINGLIIDLRADGGGSLKEVIRLTSLFIEQGPVVQVRDAFDRIKVYVDSDPSILYNGKIIVMIDRHSASASEIFAAAMQDYNRAIIVGQTTFGKGTVQQGRSLKSMFDTANKQLGMLQYTIQKFYRINGGSTQQKGVEPDIHYPEIINAKEVGERFEDNALPWDKITPAEYKITSNARDVVPYLTKNHLQRIAKDPEFIALAEDIAIEREEDNEKFLSLNLKARQKRRQADEQRDLRHLNARFKREGKKPLKNLEALPKDYEAPDFVLKETEKMMADWLNINKKQQ
ncbi:MULTISPECIES: carboxy terminal-processing peptidase [Pasteurellaceae]|uniref:Carboxy terminal-processing peptidase n=1 Tax=Pasteurella atlantica TaxID=2827233 RepID=A0AAW8CNY1_9PAST|nr:carboxy terminal-processing peptidase [Pasteurella atlantica]MBR0574420.1 carboxy terminal-processing peptidase [Pasteurella atlantica]MDP8040341.1 carboxy terminal-processing peptidase [Pasteurella atlantica]MDP8042475.1 carboxy terminal-processing peptidase [Pasteurella atlantica]MDP8044611.1 carboxy terminal-processing peptidase [Pasteurella atlantica]MDP8046642.1 carboxy terminal-processing peptidase [Pasteurella atlantica]